jgi:preprotein translocase subunit YajC
MISEFKTSNSGSNIGMWIAGIVITATLYFFVYKPYIAKQKAQEGK